MGEPPSAPPLASTSTVTSSTTASVSTPLSLVPKRGGNDGFHEVETADEESQGTQQDGSCQTQEDHPQAPGQGQVQVHYDGEGDVKPSVLVIRPGMSPIAGPLNLEMMNGAMSMVNVVFHHPGHHPQHHHHQPVSFVDANLRQSVTPPKAHYEDAEKERRRERQRELNRNRMRMKRAMLTFEEREEERRINRERMRKIRSEMPDDERERMKMKRREEARLRRAMESPEQRQARLTARSGTKRRKRSLNNSRTPGTNQNSSSAGTGTPASSSSSSASDQSTPPNSSGSPTSSWTPSNQHSQQQHHLVAGHQHPHLSPGGIVPGTPQHRHLHHPHAHMQVPVAVPVPVPNLPIFPGCGLAEPRGSWIDYSTLPMTRP